MSQINTDHCACVCYTDGQDVNINITSPEETTTVCNANSITVKTSRLVREFLDRNALFVSFDCTDEMIFDALRHHQTLYTTCQNSNFVIDTRNNGGTKWTLLFDFSNGSEWVYFTEQEDITRIDQGRTVDVLERPDDPRGNVKMTIHNVQNCESS